MGQYAVEVECTALKVNPKRTEHRVEERVEGHDERVVVLERDAVERGPAEHVVAEAALKVRAEHDGAGAEQLERAPARQRGSARVGCSQRGTVR